MKHLFEFKDNQDINVGYIEAKLQEIRDAIGDHQGDWFLCYDLDEEGLDISLVNSDGDPNNIDDCVFDWTFDAVDMVLYSNHSDEKENCSSYEEVLSIIETNLFNHIGIYEKISTFNKFDEGLVGHIQRLNPKRASNDKKGRKVVQEIRDDFEKHKNLKKVKICDDKGSKIRKERLNINHIMIKLNKLK